MLSRGVVMPISRILPNSQGEVWRPGTEVVTRLYSYGDTVAQCWIPETKQIITGTSDQELYRFGIQ